MKKQIEFEKSFKGIFPEKAEHWDYDENPDNPEDVSSKANKPRWFKCDKKELDHPSFRSTLSNLAKGSWCPRCGEIKRRETYTENYKKVNGTFASVHPDKAEHWDYDLNEDNPEDLPPAVNDVRWFKCDKKELKHPPFKSTLGNIHKGQWCPKCRYIKSPVTLRKTIIERTGSFKQRHPERADCWASYNIDSPEDLPAGAKDKRWFVCDKNKEHKDFQMRLQKVHAGQWCPECKKSGFKCELPSYYYIFYSDKLSIFKSGITNFISMRTDQLNRAFIQAEYKLVFLHYHEDGYNIKNAESYNRLNMNRVLLHGEKFDGCSETYPESEIFFLMNSLNERGIFNTIPEIFKESKLSLILSGQFISEYDIDKVYAARGKTREMKIKAENDKEIILCTFCGYDHTVKSGVSKSGIQQYLCRKRGCEKIFMLESKKNITPPDKIEEVLRLRKEGFKHKDIAEKLDLCTFTVFTYLKKYGLTEPKKINKK